MPFLWLSSLLESLLSLSSTSYTCLNFPPNFSSQEAGRLSISLLRACASQLCLQQVETCPCPNLLFFSLQNPWVIVVGLARGQGGGGALVFLLPRVMIVTSGRVVLQPFHTTKLRAEVSCAGVSSGTLPGAFFQLSADSSRAGGTGVTCLFCICGVHIRGDSIYRYKHFILKCREFRCELPCSRPPVYYSQKVYWDKRFRKDALSVNCTSGGYKGQHVSKGGL